MMDKTDQNKSAHEPTQPEAAAAYLRPQDQKSTVAIIFCLLAWLAGTLALYWLNKGGFAQIDKLPENEYAFQVDLNEADWTEISALPTIGETIARRITTDRDSHGPFSSLQSLTRVDGVGNQTINTIRPYVAGLPQSDKMVVDNR